MTSFLTEDLRKTFSFISLDYTYKYALNFIDRQKRGVSSTSDRGHYEILLYLMNHEMVQYDSYAYEYLIDMDMFNGANRLAELGDMIFHNIKSKEHLFSSILYCPPSLTDYQQLRLRLWYEYFQSINTSFGISTFDGTKHISIEKENSSSFLEEKGIFNDEYIHSLTKKYPDYKGYN